MYTKEQLVKAMTKYLENARNNPDKFYNEVDDFEKSANECIDYLITLIDEK